MTAQAADGGLGRLSWESPQYRGLRDELTAAEIALRDQRERVATLRRELPLDTVVEDYALREGPTDLAKKAPLAETHLSSLFELPDKPLVVYHYMYGAGQTEPCPMCSLLVDGLGGVARHTARVVNLAIVAEAEIGALRRLAQERGWHGLRVLSSAGSRFKRDFGFQGPDGGQYPGVSVFQRGADGTLRHAYSGSAILGEDEYRGLDLLMPLWHLLDLTPAGRGEWSPGLTYE